MDMDMHLQCLLDLVKVEDLLRDKEAHELLVHRQIGELLDATQHVHLLRAVLVEGREHQVDALALEHACALGLVALQPRRVPHALVGPVDLHPRVGCEGREKAHNATSEDEKTA